MYIKHKLNEAIMVLNGTSLRPREKLSSIKMNPIGYYFLFAKLHKEFGCFPFSFVSSVDLQQLTFEDLQRQHDKFHNKPA